MNEKKSSSIREGLTSGVSDPKNLNCLVSINIGDNRGLKKPTSLGRHSNQILCSHWDSPCIGNSGRFIITKRGFDLMKQSL